MSEDKKIEELNPETEELKKQVEEYKKGWQRAVADFENYKRRDEQMHIQLVEMGQEQAIKVFLGILEDLERVFQHLPQDVAEEQQNQLETWRSGAEAVRKRMEDSLKQLGIEKVETEGQRFNIDIHEAVGEIEDEQGEPGIVAQEITPGYKRGDKLIKPAQVKVYKGN